MGKAKRQSSLPAVVALLLLLGPAVLPAAEGDLTAYPRPEGPSVLDTPTPLGRLQYVPGRGLRVGDTKLTLGGFATLTGEQLEGKPASGAVDALDLFVFYDPVPYLHLFSAFDVSELANFGGEDGGVNTKAHIDVDRLYADVTPSDLFNVRVGKFLTPIGRWNQAPADPLVWTTSEPIIAESVFDDFARGAGVFGATFPKGNTLSYWAYGTFLDTLDPEPEANPAEHSAGGRLEWTSLGGWSVGASYFASKRKHQDWHHLGGVDALWRPHERVELSMEAVAGEGTQDPGQLWGVFAQAVVETVPTLYAVGRYEHFDPPHGDPQLNLFTVGLTWVPKYYLRLKVDYQFADHQNDFSPPGLRMSFSVLF